MNSFFDTFRNAWKIPDLKKKLLYTLALLLIFRVGCCIPIPGLSSSTLSNVFGGSTGIGAFLSIISGNTTRQITIFAMSITPYINSSIIIQLLTVAIPALGRMAKEGGEEGRKKLGQITRYTTVGLAIFQSLFIALNLRSANEIEPTWFGVIFVMIALTAGTAFLMWLGEQITDKGIGNGISLIIFAGIVSNGPSAAVSLYTVFLSNEATVNIIVGILCIILVLLIFLAIIALVIFVTEAERKIPVQYAKRVVGRKMYGGQSTNIPIKINSAGVLPIIFAMSILAFPGTIVNLFFPNTTNSFALGLANFSGNSWYPVVNALLVIAFTYFYSSVYFNPKDISDNLKDNGGFIPGIRPGKPTTDYIKAVSNRTTTAGALFLALITVLPSILQIVLRLINSSFASLNLWLGGTSILILVGVALETVKQIQSYMLARHYKGFLE